MNTTILSVHRFRRVARRREREVQAWLDARRGYWLPEGPDIPVWVHGARVERAGLLQYAVVGTDVKGR